MYLHRMKCKQPSLMSKNWRKIWAESPNQTFPLVISSRTVVYNKWIQRHMPVIGAPTQEDCHKLKASFGYIVNSRTVWASDRNSIPNKQKQIMKSSKVGWSFQIMYSRTVPISRTQSKFIQHHQIRKMGLIARRQETDRSWPPETTQTSEVVSNSFKIAVVTMSSDI